MGFLLRIGGLIGGALLLIMVIGTQTIRIDREDAYWMIVESDGLQLMTGSGELHGSLDATIFDRDERIWWSPDGQWMLHYYQIGGLRSVNITQPEVEYQIEDTTNSATELTTPLFSPDGRWVLFSTYRYPFLFRSRPDGRDKEVVDAHSECICYYGWTENGQIESIANGTIKGELRRVSENKLRVIRFGPEFDELETPHNQLLIGYNLSGIYWLTEVDSNQVESIRITPDGYRNYQPLAYLETDWILYRASPLVGENRDPVIFKIRPDGTDLEMVLDNDQYKWRLNWSADGKWLYFWSSEGWYVRTGLDEDVTELVFSDKNIYPVWTSDHEWLLFGQDEGEETHFYKMHSNGGEPIHLFQLPNHIDLVIRLSDSNEWIHINYPIDPYQAGGYVHQRIRFSDGKVEPLPDGKLVNLSPQFMMMESDLTPLWVGLGLMAVSVGLMLVEVYRVMRGQV